MRTCAIESHLALISIWAAMRGWYAAISIRWIFFNRILFRYISTVHKSRWLQLSRLIWYAHPIFSTACPSSANETLFTNIFKTFKLKSKPNKTKIVVFTQNFKKRELPMSFVDGWSASNGSQCERARLRHHFITIYTYFFFAFSIFLRRKHFLANEINGASSVVVRLLLRQQAQWCYEMAKHRYHIWIVFLFQLNESEWETLSPIWQTYFRFSLDQINIPFD